MRKKHLNIYSCLVLLGPLVYQFPIKESSQWYTGVPRRGERVKIKKNKIKK